ncbi:MAG: hypothetical protein E2601_03930 [Microbacterium sp.]|nr:hypothetical protein [Microbacterium sp.]
MTRPRLIRLEKGPSGVTVRCAGCDWNAFRFDMLEAHDTASAHEERAHPGDYRARNAAKMYRRRHAETTANV